jgi:hypothetical protein
MKNLQLYRVGRLGLTLLLLLSLTWLALPTRTAQAASISEGFDSGIPAGWVRRNRSNPLGLGSWYQCNTSGSVITLGFYGGDGSCVVADNRSTTGSTGTISNWLISPLITTLKNGDVISFYTRTVAHDPFYPDRLQVYVSTNGSCSPGTTSTSTGDFTKILFDINPGLEPDVYPNYWFGYTVTLSGITGTVSGCVGFRYYVTNAGPSGGNGYIIGLDEFRYQDSTQATQTRTPTLTATFTPSRTPTFTPSPTPTKTYTPSPTVTPRPPQQDTIGVYLNGTWYLRNSNSSGPQDYLVNFSPGQDPRPLVGDWNGDGVDTVGVFDNVTGVFYLSDSNAAPAINYSVVFGNPGDMPLHGRWVKSAAHDGLGVYRPTNGIIYLRNDLTTGFSDFYQVLGNPGDAGVAGDWDGDYVETVGVYRPSNQTWYMANANGNGIVFSDIDFVWVSTSRVVSGDWVGDGITRVGYLTETGNFALHGANTGAAQDNVFPFGPASANAYPVAGHWFAAAKPPQPGAINQQFPPTRNGNPVDPGRGD